MTKLTKSISLLQNIYWYNANAGKKRLWWLCLTTTFPYPYPYFPGTDGIGRNVSFAELSQRDVLLDEDSSPWQFLILTRAPCHSWNKNVCPCLVSFLTFSCISSFTFLLSLQPHFTVMDSASLEPLLLSQMSLQWDIGSKEPICIHANEAESVHPSCWACQYTLMTTHTHRSALRAVRIYKLREYNILFFPHIRPVGRSPHWYLL